MGFERLNVEISAEADDSIEVYQPLSTEIHVQRLIDKMRKHHILDLSFVLDLESIFSVLDQCDLSSLEHIFMAGVNHSLNDAQLFDRLHDKYPHVKVWCTSLDAVEKSRLDRMIINAKNPSRFVSIGYLLCAPIFSPLYFHQMMKQGSPLQSAPWIQFMRGISLEPSIFEPISLHERFLTAELFFAINRDESTCPAKEMIRKLLNREILDYDKKITLDVLLKEINDSPMSASLKNTAIDYIRLVPLRCFNFATGNSYYLQDTSEASKAIANELNDEGKGIFAPEDWVSFPKKLVC